MIGTHHPFSRYEEGPQKYPKIVDDETIIFVFFFCDRFIWSYFIATSHDLTSKGSFFFSEGKLDPFISGKSRLVKYYYHLARFNNKSGQAATAKNPHTADLI